MGAGDVRVRLHASSLNYHDYLVCTGVLPTPDGRVPLSDGAGEVVAVGSAVTELAVGDRVVSTFYPQWLAGVPDRAATAHLPGDRTDGYAREEVVAPATAFSRAPEGWSHAEAATLTCAGLTAWRALFVETTVAPGQTVLVQGTGGVSVYALQLAKAAGATVIATTSSEDKRERLVALGADHVVNYRTDPSWGRTAKALTGGRGVDHVVEIGGDLRQTLAACGHGAHVALVAMLDLSPATFPFVPMITKSVRITGLSVGNREHHLAMVRGVEATGLRPVIDVSYPLEQIAAAFRHQESGRHVGKICLEW